MVHYHVVPLQQRAHGPQHLLLLVVLRRANILDPVVQSAAQAQERLAVDLRQPVGVPLLRGVRRGVENQHAVDGILHPPDAVLVGSHVFIALPDRGNEEVDPHQGEDDEVGPEDAHAQGPEKLAGLTGEHGARVLGFAEEPEEHGEVHAAGVPPEAGHLFNVGVIVIPRPHAHTCQQNSKTHPKTDVKQQKHQNGPPDPLKNGDHHHHIGANLVNEGGELEELDPASNGLDGVGSHSNILHDTALSNLGQYR
mmetsp:Transcript_45593/g.103296  ORF Transcript_45593/g.103296 Transcript_45593/m.103296 type:complete len:252 (-) Transcript_45593:1843-2598(-)